MRYLLIAIFLMGSLSGATADTVTQRAADTAARAAARMPGNTEELKAGFACLDRGESEAAYAFFAPRLLDAPDDLDIMFGYGLACLQTGRASHASFAFETILERNPNADRVRLELARAYLADGRLPEAKREFTAVLERNPPAEVRQNIELILSGIDRATPGASVSFHGMVSTSMFNSNNVNSGINTNSVILKDATFAIDGNNQAKSDAGAIGIASFLVTIQPQPDVPILLQPAVTVYQKWHDSFRTNDLTYLAPGLTLIYQPNEKWQFSLEGQMQDVTFDYQALSRTWHGGLTVRSTPWPEVTSATEFTATHTSNKTTWARSGNTYGVAETLSFKLPRNFRLDVGGEFSRARAVEERYANREWAGSGTLTVPLPWTCELSIGGGYTRTAYDDPSTAQMAGIDRKDRAWDFSSTLSKTFWENWQASYDYAYTKNNSNTDIHDYRTGTHTLGVSYSF